MYIQKRVLEILENSRELPPFQDKLSFVTNLIEHLRKISMIMLVVRTVLSSSTKSIYAILSTNTRHSQYQGGSHIHSIHSIYDLYYRF